MSGVEEGEVKREDVGSGGHYTENRDICWALGTGDLRDLSGLVPAW